jgi:hypothetical protein
MQIEVFTLETDQGLKRISMRSTGKGAWISISSACANPLKVVNIRPVFWIATPEDINKLIKNDKR